MKHVKITTEITITPEEFEKWCDGKDILPTERMYHQFIEGTIYNKFRTSYDFGEYKDYINTTIDDNGLKLTFEQLK
jgi:Uma2 family endonuclease